MPLASPIVFQDQILETVTVTSELEGIFQSLERENPRLCAWRYFASENGVFRIFPGIKLIREYDANKRRW